MPPDLNHETGCASALEEAALPPYRGDLKPRDGLPLGTSMRSMRYIQITSHESIKVIDVVTQVHYLLTPGEAPDPVATFWDLTVGGVPISSEDERHSAHLLSSKQVTALATALRTQTWESLEANAKASCDMFPGWQEGLRPEFEKLRDFFLDASEKGYAVLRVSSKDGFFYR